MAVKFSLSNLSNRTGGSALAMLTAASLSLSACGGVVPGGGQGAGHSAPSASQQTPPGSANSSGAIRHRFGTGQSIRVASDPQNALGQMIALGPAVGQLGLNAEDARDALIVFRNGCPSLVNINRRDASGLTRAQDWQTPCDAARNWGEYDAVNFFTQHFETVQIADGAAFATGYFEPEIAASRNRGGVYQTPIYSRPNDLIDVDLGQFAEEWQGKTVRGKLSGTKLVQYDDRTMIENGSLSGRAQILGYAADPVELFFLQVQGSGRLLLPDGKVMRIGYASQNGRDYTGIGGLMKERGLLAPGKSSMQGIVEYLHANPAEGREIMRENKSYVFFRELTGAGPLGAMGYPVYAYSSAAVDPKYIPMGAPLFLDMDRAEPNGLWVAQDTGGAIKGTNRIDTFWGAGEQAAITAGGMSARGQALILLPRGSFARLAGQARN